MAKKPWNLQDAVNKALEKRAQVAQVKAALEDLDRKAPTVVERLNQGIKTVTDSLAKLQTGVAMVGDVIQRTFGAGSSYILGFARAGLQASVYGEQLNLAMTRLTLTLGGLFRPEIEKILALLSRFVAWMQNLSENSRTAIARITVLSAVFATFAAVVVPAVIAGIYAITTAVTTLVAAIAAGEVMTGIGAILPILGGLAAAAVAAVAFFSTTETGAGAIAGLSRSLASLGPQLERLLANFNAGITILADFFERGFAATQPMRDSMIRDLGRLVDAISLLIEYNLPRLMLLAEGFLTVARAVSLLVQKVDELNERFAEWGGSGPAAIGFKALMDLEKAAYERLGLRAPAGEKGPGRESLPLKSSGFGDLGSFFDRAQVALLNATTAGGGKPIEERQLEAQQDTNHKLDTLNETVRRSEGAVKGR